MLNRRRLVGIIVVLVALYLLRFQWLPPIAGWLNVSQPRLPVRYVVPLPGGNDTRPFAAAALVRADLAERVAVVVNQKTPNVIDGTVLPMHQVTEEVLRRRGVDSEKITLLKGESSSTFSDIQIIAGLIEQEPDATIAILTSPSHTRRVRFVVNRLLPAAGSKICVIATYNDTFHEHSWWRDQGGQHEILSEYLKLIFYVIRYSSPGQRVAFGVMISLVAFALFKLACWTRARRHPESDPSLANSA